MAALPFVESGVAWATAGYFVSRGGLSEAHESRSPTYMLASNFAGVMVGPMMMMFGAAMSGGGFLAAAGFGTYVVYSDQQHRQREQHENQRSEGERRRQQQQADERARIERESAADIQRIEAEHVAERARIEAEREAEQERMLRELAAERGKVVQAKRQRTYSLIAAIIFLAISAAILNTQCSSTSIMMLATSLLVGISALVRHLVSSVASGLMRVAWAWWQHGRFADNGTADNTRIEDKVDANQANRTDQHVCAICMDRPRSHLFTPCGHAGFCLPCADHCLTNERRCPICRDHIDGVQIVHF